jgi:hypothetical protein
MPRAAHQLAQLMLSELDVQLKDREQLRNSSGTALVG